MSRKIFGIWVVTLMLLAGVAATVTVTAKQTRSFSGKCSFDNDVGRIHGKLINNKIIKGKMVVNGVVYNFKAKLYSNGCFRGTMWSGHMKGRFTGTWFIQFNSWLLLIWDWYGHSGYAKALLGTSTYPSP